MERSFAINKLFSFIHKRVYSRKRGKAGKTRLAGQLLLVAATGTLLFAFAGPNIMKNVHYQGLLNTIARGESGGNYNAYFGKPDNTSVKFTSMTVGEVLQWQREYVENGSPSNAVGRYQFIRPTLAGLVEKHEIDKDARFGQQLQDKLAIALLEKRGVHDYMSGDISREQFAHNLSKEWAALPQVKGDKPKASYYAEDGLNKVQISIDEIYRGIGTLDSTVAARHN